jgi:hypothetical protein
MRILERREITSGRERQVRFGLHLEDALKTEAWTDLGRLYRFWEGAPTATDGVRYADIIELLDLVPVATPNFVTILGTDVESAYEFYVIERARKTGFDYEKTMRIGDIVSPLDRKFQIVDYAFAKRDRCVKVDEIHQWLEVPARNRIQTRNYLRFLFPLCDANGGIVRFMVATRLLAENIVPLTSALQTPLLTVA